MKKTPHPETTYQVQWTLFFQHMAHVQWKGKKLGLAITQVGPNYQLLAIETDGKTETEVLDSHAHEYLGKFATVEKAQRRAEKYARAWIKRQREADALVELEKCVCGPIRKKTTKKGSR